jgi:hypothetical protein
MVGRRLFNKRARLMIVNVFCDSRFGGATLRGEDFLAHAVARDERIFKLNHNL